MLLYSAGFCIYQKAQLGRDHFHCGVFSTIFGFMFGSIFGFEDVDTTLDTTVDAYDDTCRLSES